MIIQTLLAKKSSLLMICLSKTLSKLEKSARIQVPVNSNLEKFASETHVPLSKLEKSAISYFEM